MWLHDLLMRFDDALDWQLDDDALLADHTPPNLVQEPWPRVGEAAA